jgi:hypothetical protein
VGFDAKASKKWGRSLIQASRLACPGVGVQKGEPNRPAGWNEE